jgi:hypothetical protein
MVKRYQDAIIKMLTEEGVAEWSLRFWDLIKKRSLN